MAAIENGETPTIFLPLIVLEKRFMHDCIIRSILVSGPSCQYRQPTQKGLYYKYMVITMVLIPPSTYTNPDLLQHTTLPCVGVLLSSIGTDTPLAYACGHAYTVWWVICLSYTSYAHVDPLPPLLHDFLMQQPPLRCMDWPGCLCEH